MTEIEELFQNLNEIILILELISSKLKFIAETQYEVKIILENINKSVHK